MGADPVRGVTTARGRPGAVDGVAGLAPRWGSPTLSSGADPRPGAAPTSRWRQSAAGFGRRYPRPVTIPTHWQPEFRTGVPPAPASSTALEELLPLVTKPIQYVGGEVNAVIKDWDAADVRWALMYPDAYEVGAPNQGVQILYEVLNERDDALAERTYSVWPDLEALMREHGVPQFTVDAHRAVGDFDVFGLSFSTELGYTNMLTAIDLAGIPLLARRPRRVAPGRRRRRPRGVQPRADRRLRRRRGAGRRRGGRPAHHRHRARSGSAPAARAAARGCCCELALTGSIYVPRFYDVDYLEDGRIQRVAPEPARRAVARAQAHADGPRRVGVPEEPAGAAGRDGARAHGRRDLPRLHPRLPLLPGRHDHAARCASAASRASPRSSRTG